MLLTARLCLEKGYRFGFACPRCTTWRVIGPGWAQRVIDKGRGDEPLAALFERGLIRCAVHHAPAVQMAVDHDRDCTVDHIAAWTKEGPAR